MTQQLTKPSEILSAAADLIEPEGRWTQEDYARKASGAGCWPGDPEAVCWCSIGATNRVASANAAAEARRFLMTFIGSDVASWNDRRIRTQAQVVAAFRQAAEKAREAGQ